MATGIIQGRWLRIFRKGITDLIAVSVVAEVGKLSRFPNPRELMGYSGLVSSEHSGGRRIQRGSITKTGNVHLRRVIVEAAWAYEHKPWLGGWLANRQPGLDEEIKAIALATRNWQPKGKTNR